MQPIGKRHGGTAPGSLRRSAAGVLLLLAAGVVPAVAQAPAAPPARAADVASIDAIISAVYDVISGPAGQQRDWDRMRSLFVPGARLIPTIYRPDSTPRLLVWSVDQYIDVAGPRLEQNGFFEREVARTIERYGGVVQAFSTYESRHAAGDPQPFARGINSFQLWNDGTRWWIVTIYWEAERPGNPIPDRYRPHPGGR
jgi:hypothetical protein